MSILPLLVLASLVWAFPGTGKAEGLLGTREVAVQATQSSVLFTDSFERDRTQWIVRGPGAVSMVESGGPAHAEILQLTPAGKASWR